MVAQSTDHSRIAYLHIIMIVPNAVVVVQNIFRGRKDSVKQVLS
jgi:hypothetical protein